LLFLLFLTPFLTVSLAAPEWTGESGAGLALYLDYWLGRAAWMLPVVTMAIALILFEANPVRESHLRSGVPVLFLGLVLLAARLDHQGGLLGGLPGREARLSHRTFRSLAGCGLLLPGGSGVALAGHAG